MSTRVTGVAITTLLLLGVVSTGLVVTADSTYELTATDAVETPETSIDIRGSEYAVDHIAVIEPGDSITVNVVSDSNYFLYLYNEDGHSEYGEYHSDSVRSLEIGTTDDELDTNNLTAGTYMLSLEPNSEREAVVPVVVQGYDLSLEYQQPATVDSELEITATVEPKDGLDRPDAVEVAIWDGDDVTELTLDHVGGVDYEKTVPASALGVGEYSVYGAIMGEDEVEGYPTALAVAEGESIAIVENDDDSDTSGGSDQASDDDGTVTDDEADGTSDDDGTDTDDEADETSDDGTEADLDTNGEETEDDGDDGSAGDGDDATEHTDDAASNESTADESSVLQPTADEQPDESSDDDELGIGGTAVLAIALVVLALGHRARNDA
ncbi:hypothetical protein [Natronorubrum thiooxidans]|uniref:Uncharacterized protein n=1 Tax=Natronorubrum thiooxidans TaxID=308853 RepID=A0A1N7GDI1_9EURY|nr:hypothetical protein [Natronorubrum thiooxidans]SIS10624.1 hypothetical protein SAMN05421752_11193 [Natronorubrum thiooxidans]